MSRALHSEFGRKALECLGRESIRFGGLGLQGLGFRALGFRVLGFRALGFRV